jgi:hypothetical protein
MWSKFLATKSGLNPDYSEGIPKVNYYRNGRKERAKITKLKYWHLTTLLPLRNTFAGSEV